MKQEMLMDGRNIMVIDHLYINVELDLVMNRL